MTAGRVWVREMGDSFYRDVVQPDTDAEAERLHTQLSRHGLEKARIREVLKEVAMEAFIRGYDGCCDRQRRYTNKKKGT